MADNNPMQDRVVVKIGEGESLEEFSFKLPSPRDLAKINVKADSLRRRDDPESLPPEDYWTQYLYRGFALLETLDFTLDCKDNWPFSEDPKDKSKVIIDSSKFPPGSETKIVAIWGLFQEELTRFHKNRTGLKQPTDTKAVEGSPD